MNVMEEKKIEKLQVEALYCDKEGALDKFQRKLVSRKLLVWGFATGLLLSSKLLLILVWG